MTCREVTTDSEVSLAFFHVFAKFLDCLYLDCRKHLKINDGAAEEMTQCLRALAIPAEDLGSFTGDLSLSSTCFHLHLRTKSFFFFKFKNEKKI